MDVADLAQKNDFTEAALRAYESGMQRRAGPSAMRCEDCGDAIDERRRQAEPGTQHCTECKAAIEQLRKRGLR